MTVCAECGKEFEATKNNSVDMRIGIFYATVCKACAKQLQREGKIRILKQGSVKLE